MSRLNEIRVRLEAATEEPFYKRVAIWGSGPTRYMLQPYLLEEDIAFILDSREDMALLLAVVKAVMGDGTLKSAIELYDLRGRNVGGGDPYWIEYNWRIRDALKELT